MPTCDDCRFWHETGPASPDTNALSGECRRRAPPSLARAGREIEAGDLSDWPHAVWPTTYEGDWCGEHEPARNVQ